MDKEIIKQFYSNEMEKDRLDHELFKLEGIRTKTIIGGYLTKSKMSIADIGGGAGYYAFWLQAMGHEVTLVDLSPKNIELVSDYTKTSGIRLTNFRQGDATQLNLPDEGFDLVLLLGPLYHLTDHNERIKALSEARRILKPGGFVLCAVISRYASLFDGFKRDLVFDDHFVSLLNNDLETGVHLNATENPDYFTTAYFHTPGEIRDEIKESGLKLEKLSAVEGFGWIVDHIQFKVQDEKYMGKLNRFLDKLETNDDLMAMSHHIIGVGKRD